MVKKLLFSLWAIVLLVGAALFTVESYPKAELYAQQEGSQSSIYDVAYAFENHVSLRTLPYALKAEVTSSQDAYDVLLDVQCDDPLIATRIKGVFGVYYGYWKSHIYEYPNVHSAVKDLKTLNTAGTHQELLDQSINDLKEDYQIVIKLSYDSSGVLMIQTHDLVNFSWKNQFDDQMKKTIEQYMQSEVRSVLSEVDASLYDFSLSPIKDMEMVIAVPYVLETGDLLYSEGQPAFNSHFIRMLGLTVFAVSCVLFFISLFMPMRVVKEIKSLRNLLNIKFEILCVLLVLALLEGGFVMLWGAVYSVDGSLLNLLERVKMNFAQTDFIVLVNGGMWFVFYALVMFSAMLVRWIFQKGLFVYIKENTCVAWCVQKFVSLIRWMMSLFDQLMSFDLKDNTNQFVLKVVGITFIILILCSLFPLGLILAPMYSIALFFYLKKKLGRIQSDYANVLYTTMMLSDGNFNVSVEEDAGMFNSLKRALGTLKTGFQKAVNEEVKSQRMKSELITNVSHDLKTPLTSMITYVDLLKKCDNEEERQQYIETLERNSDRLKHLIEDLFEVSKVQSGNVVLNLMEVDLVSLIRQVHLECEEALKEKNLEVRINTSDEKILLQLDSAKAFRIFENLLLNISKYAMNSTRVFIDMMQSEDTVKVIFKNISEQELDFNPEEITERFVQGDASRNSQGSGLGLAIVKSFTELHLGHFHVEVDGDLFKAIVELPR
ncbi:MAG: HAMP domain-containing histidine kinase [Erysipelotrichaceae bacterium]|nr:HAMP domain-containing histidine kinase [Erysipelotrichaceae bacterium]